MVNTWFLDEIIQDGNDITQRFNDDYPNFLTDLRKDNTIVTTYYDKAVGAMVKRIGKWKFSKDKEELIITYDDRPGEESKEKIIRLMNDELWTELDYGITKFEFHFKPK